MLNTPDPTAKERVKILLVSPSVFGYVSNYDLDKKSARSIPK